MQKTQNKMRHRQETQTLCDERVIVQCQTIIDSTNKKSYSNLEDSIAILDFMFPVLCQKRGFEQSQVEDIRLDRRRETARTWKNISNHITVESNSLERTVSKKDPYQSSNPAMLLPCSSVLRSIASIRSLQPFQIALAVEERTVANIWIWERVN
jgi:hypothetical protein